MFAIIEMEKTLAANTTGYQSLQNVNSAQAAKKKTLSDYEYTLRNEIILNIQNEKDWWLNPIPYSRQFSLGNCHAERRAAAARARARAPRARPRLVAATGGAHRSVGSQTPH